MAKRIKPGEIVGKPVQSSDVELTAPKNPFDGIFSRPLPSELSPQERAIRGADDLRASIEYWLACRVLAHPKNTAMYGHLLSAEPKAKAYYEREWCRDKVESKLQREAENLAAWKATTKSDGLNANQVLYEVFTRTRYNPFTAKDRGLDSLVRRLAQVVVGVELPRLEDSLYLSF